MTVTIQGVAAQLSYGGLGLGVAGLGGTVELRPRHPSGIRPQYPFTKAVLSDVDPLTIDLDAGGAIPSGVAVLASGALKPDGCYHHITWNVETTEGVVEVIEYDAYIGPEGGTCVITDPAIRVDTYELPFLAGWPPDLPPLTVYVAEGSP